MSNRPLARPPACRRGRRSATASAGLEPLEGRAMLSGVAGWMVPLIAQGWTTSQLKVYRQELRQYKAHQAAVANHTAGHPLDGLVRYSVTAPTVGSGKTGTSVRAATPLATYSPVVGAYSPLQVETAYGVTALGTANQGQGMTIGIVDEYDDASIVSDANVFSAQYALPQFNGTGTPTLTVYKDTAFGAVPASPKGGSGTTADETSLDVEWAHAMAPRANILLVEVPATVSVANEFAELLHGVQYAAGQGCQAVSLSYGYTESGLGASNVTSLNNSYLAAGAAAGTVITVSSGDSTYPGYPATSPNVVAVGGSSLYLASAKGKYSYETAWGGLSGYGAGGGGLSSVFGPPTFQSGNNVKYADRAVPDVALIADPVTAVSVYDSYDAGTGDPWGAIGGTSLASPVFAGMVTLAQQTRVAAGKALLTSAQVDADIYSLYNSAAYTTYFHDITLGNNKDVGTSTTSYSAATGYDLATGVGSPIGSTFVPQLASL